MSERVGTCSRCGSPIERGDLRCAICGEVVPEGTVTREETVVQVLRCTGCGAAVAYDPEHRAPACSFCDSVFHLETIEDPMEQTEGYVPFTVSPGEAKAALKRWLASQGWFRPSDLRSAAKLESLRPLWWVAWVFDAQARVSWTADSDEGSRRSAWAPHSGQTEMEFSTVLVSASRGLRDHEVDAVAPGCDPFSARPTPEGADDAILEQFDVQRSQARQRLVAGIQRVAERRVTKNHVPGKKFRNVHCAVLLRGLTTSRMSFPAYVLAYRYHDQLYRAVVCGQDASKTCGTAPISYLKVAAVIGLAVIVVLVIIAIVASAAG